MTSTTSSTEGGGGAIPLHGVAADDVSLRVVNLYLDGALVLTSGGSIERPLKTWTLTNGVHRLFIEAFDQAGIAARTAATISQAIRLWDPRRSWGQPLRRRAAPTPGRRVTCGSDLCMDRSAASTRCPSRRQRPAIRHPSPSARCSSRVSHGDNRGKTQGAGTWRRACSRAVYRMSNAIPFVSTCIVMWRAAPRCPD